MTKFPSRWDWDDPDPRDAPIIGPWISKAGRVIDVVSEPCNPDPLVAVKAAFHGIPLLAWTLLKPDPLDAAFDRAGLTHKRKRRKIARMQHIEFPDISPPKNKLGWAMWTGAKVAERVGWYMLIIDATLDFAVYWTTTTWAYSGCRVPNAHFANGIITGGVPGNTGGEWQDINFWAPQNTYGFSMTPFSIEIPKNYVASITFGMSVQPPPPPFEPFTDLAFRLIDINSGLVVSEQEATRLQNGDWTAGDSFKSYVENPQVQLWRVQYRASSGWGQFVGSRFSAYGSKDIGIDPDP